MKVELATSCIEVISSIHGNQRRAERSIDKCDLQAAVKHGTREIQHRNGKIRYKYTFAGIVYITDRTGRHEITSYMLPLTIKLALVLDNDINQYKAAKQRINRDPNLIKTHSVFVIDCSGSMRKSDVQGHKSRSDAVKYTIATEFIAKRLHNPESNVTPFDVVTIIEMRTDAKVVFYKEPMTWVFYNLFVQQPKQNNSNEHGNYIPSLDLAMEMLTMEDHKHLSLFLMFLSDGRPSDLVLSRINRDWPRVTMSDIFKRASAISRKFKKRLSFGTVGFGTPIDDFTVLQTMARRMTRGGSVGTFHRSDLNKMGSLATSLANMSSTLTKTRTLLSMIQGETRIERPVTISIFKKNIATPPRSWDIITVRDNRLYCLEFTQCSTHGKDRKGSQFEWKRRPLLNARAAGIACNNQPFGKGAERLVYQLREIDASGKFVGSPLVGKDNKFDDSGDSTNLHSVFCKTQMVAANLAKTFNQRLDMSPEVGKMVPRIKFLECYVYCFFDEYFAEFGYLVEKQLDNTQYRKWNDNQGGVRGQRENPVKGTSEFKVNARKMLKGLKPIIQDTIMEEDEEESNSEDEDETSNHHDVDMYEIRRKLKNLHLPNESSRNLLPIVNEDVPQAFTHFTHNWTKHDKMVCDLQGVLDTSCVPPVFEFTDPVIHYKSKSGRTRVFGRTDHGLKGMHEFFKTHRCNNVCQALGLRS